MNARIAAGHAAVAGLFTAAWEVAIQLPQGDPGGLLVTAGFVGPPAIAALSLALIAVGGDERRVEHARVDPAYLPPAQARRAVQGTRKELAR